MKTLHQQKSVLCFSKQKLKLVTYHIFFPILFSFVNSLKYIIHQRTWYYNGTCCPICPATSPFYTTPPTYPRPSTNTAFYPAFWRALTPKKSASLLRSARRNCYKISAQTYLMVGAVESAGECAVTMTTCPRFAIVSTIHMHVYSEQIMRNVHVLCL